MTVIFRATEDLIAQIRADLSRPHPFARERVGFISVKAARGKQNLLLIAEEYHPVADRDYLPDVSVGAMMSQEALRKALEMALLKPVGIFHVHMHGFPRRALWFSRTDLSEQLKFVPDFFKVRREMPHGAIVLSRKSAAGRAWLSPKEIVAIGEFDVVGSQLRVWRASHNGSMDCEA